MTEINKNAKEGITATLAVTLLASGILIANANKKEAKNNTGATPEKTTEDTTEDNQVSNDFMGGFDINNKNDVLNRATLIYNNLVDKNGITIPDIMNITYIYNSAASNITYPSNCTTDAQKIKSINELAKKLSDRLCNIDAEEKANQDPETRFYIANIFANPSKDINNYCNKEESFFKDKSKENVDALIEAYKNFFSREKVSNGEKAAAVADMAKLVPYLEKYGQLTDAQKKIVESQDSGYNQIIFSLAKNGLNSSDLMKSQKEGCTETPTGDHYNASDDVEARRYIGGDGTATTAIYKGGQPIGVKTEKSGGSKKSTDSTSKVSGKDKSTSSTSKGGDVVTVYYETETVSITVPTQKGSFTYDSNSKEEIQYAISRDCTVTPNYLAIDVPVKATYIYNNGKWVCITDDPQLSKEAILNGYNVVSITTDLAGYTGRNSDIRQYRDDRAEIYSCHLFR